MDDDRDEDPQDDPVAAVAAAAAADGANERPQIQDEEQWFLRNTLRSASDLRELTLPQQEEIAETKRAQSYEEQAIQRAFANQDASNEAEQAQRKKRLEEWKASGANICLRMTDSSSVLFPLAVLARQSSVIYTLATTSGRFKTDGTKKESKNDSDDNVSFSLEGYDVDSVKDFLDLVSTVDRSENAENTTTGYADVVSDYVRSSKGVGNDVDNKENEKEFPLISCCRIAHFLQCDAILTGCVSIFCNSIDTANCMSFYQLADELQLVRLAEVSLSHMMRTMGDVQSHDIWDDLSSELQSRILAIQNLLESEGRAIANHKGRPSGEGDPPRRKKVYFGSFFEYLSIFAEQVEYYRERLVEAKNQQRMYVERLEREREEREGFLEQEAREGRFHYHYRNENENENEVTDAEYRYGKGWRYAQEKIEKQELRVRRLEACMAQQKLLFLGGAGLSQIS